MPATNEHSCCCPVIERFPLVRHIIYCDTTGWIGSVGLLGLRLVMGAAFILHGWPKIQHPFDWMGATASVPAIFQLLAALAEFGGGMALIVGLLTRLASLGIMTNMIVALAIVHLPHGDPFVGKPGGHSYEPAAVYLACAVLFVILGPGRYSLDALLFRTVPQKEAGLAPTTPDNR
jgi:putative oxidoreductase